MHYMHYEPKDIGEHCDKDGARQLAIRIEKFWHKAGETKVLCRIAPAGNGRFDVRSNIAEVVFGKC
jgi:hypothetical protein